MQGMEFGQGMYAFVRKHNRTTKLAWKDIEAIFVGQNASVSGAMRCITFKTVGVRKFTPPTGHRKFPLMQEPKGSAEYESTKSDSTKWGAIFRSLGFEGADWEDS